MRSSPGIHASLTRPSPHVSGSGHWTLVDRHRWMFGRWGGAANTAADEWRTRPIGFDDNHCRPRIGGLPCVRCHNVTVAAPWLSWPGRWWRARAGPGRCRVLPRRHRRRPLRRTPPWPQTGLSPRARPGRPLQARPPPRKPTASRSGQSTALRGRHVGTKQLTTPVSGCTTISVSDIRDPANPPDHCKRFSVGFCPLVNGSLTYTNPVDACSGSRTVLGRDVPDHTRYIVLYESGPGAPHVEFTVWH